MPIPETYYYLSNSLIYDRMPLMEPAGQVHMFQVPLGHKVMYADGGSAIKTPSMTNMMFPGRLCAPEYFDVERMYCTLYSKDGLIPFTDPAWKDIRLDLKIGNRMYWEGPAWIFAHRNVVFASTIGRRGKKMRRWESLQHRTLGERIEQQQHFAVVCSGEIGNRRNAEITVALEGKLYRSIY